MARAFNRARALHRFYLTAWVFLPDPSADGHCIVAPQYPETISGGLGDWHACPFLCISVLPGCLLWRGLSGTMDPMSKTIETTYRNGCIQLPDDVHLAEDTRVTVILPDNAMPKASPDSAYSIPDLASDIGPEDLARNLEHYLYGQSKQS